MEKTATLSMSPIRCQANRFVCIYVLFNLTSSLRLVGSLGETAVVKESRRPVMTLILLTSALRGRP